jgi:hypothetical protein
VSAWTQGGDLPDAVIGLQATPGGGEAPGFSGGCGGDDGTSSCDLGAVAAASAHRQLQAQLTVPVTASTVTSVRLTVTGTAAHLQKDPTAAASVTITAPSAASTPSTKAAAPAANAAAPAAAPPAPALPANPQAITSPLPVGSLPGIPAGIPPAAPPTLSPGGNASTLFPTLHPKHTPNSTQKASSRPVANTSALPESAPVVGAQLIGLGALALGFVLAVTRLSIRRRPGPGKDGQANTATTSPPPHTPSGAPAPGQQQPGTGPAAPTDKPGNPGKRAPE